MERIGALCMTHRSHISLKTKLAAALCQMLRDDGAGKLVPVIPYEDAKLMTADQVLSLFHFDHYPIRRDDNGPDEHWNLVPRPILEHRKKTAEVDRPQMAKADRIRVADAQRRLLPKGSAAPKRGRWPSRPFPKRQRALRAGSD